MTREIIIPRKRMLHAHGKKVVFVKGLRESGQHVLMKAFIWALYLPQYPDLTVEVRIGDRYKPDVVSADDLDSVRFWGEAGQVSRDKIRSLAKRYKDTHFVIAKWQTRLDNLEKLVAEAVDGLDRSAPFDLISFPADGDQRFIDKQGNVTVTFEDTEWLRVGAFS